MKRIYIQKNDTASAVVNKLVTSHEKELTVYIPKESVLLEDPKSFRLIKREVSALKKKIIIESISSDVLDMASSAGFSVSDAVFGRRKSKIADITPSKEQEIKLHIVSNDELCDGENISKTHLSDAREVISDREDAMHNEDIYIHAHLRDNCEYENKGSWLKKILWILGFGALVSGLYVAIFIMPKANIQLTLKENVFEWKKDISASTSLLAVSNNSIPLQIFKFSKSGVFQSTASDSKMVERKASGEITIYNAYSSDAQPLIKNTRFITPDGKIFRLKESVTVPGAKILAGKISPSSIEATVEADAVGDSYNIKAVSGLKIPGFKGNPKYDGFYGDLKNGTRGGVVGEVKIATDHDIKLAREKAKLSLENQLKSEISSTIPSGFKVVEGGEAFVIHKEGVTSDPNEIGEFSYGVNMEAKVIAIREADLISIADTEFEGKYSPDHSPRKVSIRYKNPAIDWSLGRANFSVEMSGVWVKDFNIENFRSSIIGKKENELKAITSAIPGVSSVKIDLSPFWVMSVPKDIAKIEVSVK